MICADSLPDSGIEEDGLRSDVSVAGKISTKLSLEERIRLE
jgi:hypothetical protein